ncbi:MAG: DUF484 family protein [Candidatus Pelagadaptatus aseana]|uniref:DUF484 family protein n=1 Tax=Candidatus Pelagadaptatus aseana TaxID=3120508 RepID=UPI0039B2BEA0
MSDTPVLDTDTAVTEAQVVEYLRRNSDFFVSQPGLLADLSLPHESGKAISLVERQVSVLRERNMEMRHRLNKLLDNARDNDRLFDKTKKLILALLEGKNLTDTVNALFQSFEKDFGIHYTTLLLFGDSETLPPSRARVVTMHDARDAIGNLIKSNRALCGAFSDTETHYLFPEFSRHIGSVAMVPLIYGNTFGMLAIANRDPNYYRSSMGTLFLSYIGEVLNRVLPRHLP